MKVCRIRCRTHVVAVATIVACLGCQKPSDSGGERPPIAVTVATPLQMEIVEWDEYTGRLAAIDSVEVRARVSGYLIGTYFDEGKSVEKGDLLAIIDPRPFEAELSSAQANLTEATARLAEAQAIVKQAAAEKADADAQLTLTNRRLERAQQLLAGNAVAKEEVDVRISEQLQASAAVEAALATIESAKAGVATAEAGIATAQTGVDTATLNLKYTQIRAPISGRISRRNVTNGNLISGGNSLSTLITTIVAMEPIHVDFDANEQEFLKYSRLSQAGTRGSSRDVKNPVYVALVDEQGYPHQGHMDFVDNRIDPNTGTMRGRAILHNTKDNLLTPGLFVTIRLPGTGKYTATMIPDSAVGSDQSEKFVYVVNDQNEVVRRNIVLGPISHGLRIVRDGLDGPEQIVVKGLQGIYEGAKVTTTSEQIVASSNGGLPDDYQPVPKEEWISRQPDEIPENVKPNAPLYEDPINEARPPEALPPAGDAPASAEQGAAS